jgi:hypothetical protein
LCERDLIANEQVRVVGPLDDGVANVSVVGEQLGKFQRVNRQRHAVSGPFPFGRFGPFRPF